MRNVSPELIGFTHAPGASPIEKNIATLLAYNLEVLLDVKKDLHTLLARDGELSGTIPGGLIGDRPVRGDQRRDTVPVRRPAEGVGEKIRDPNVFPVAGNQTAARAKRTAK